MTPSPSTTFVLGLLALAPAAPALATPAPAPVLVARAAAEVRYVQTSANAKILNVADANGLSVAELPAGTVLTVHDERSGWLSVEPPQGLTVWVYGEFLRSTSTPGVAEVKGDGVRMRPKPSSTKDSFPLEQQLHSGDRVRIVGRHDAKKSSSEDWVRVLTPPGVRGWIPASSTAPITAGTDGRTAWNAAVKSATGALALVDLKTGADAASAAALGSTTPASAGSATAAAKPDAAPVQSAFDAAEKAYESARTAPSADWAAVRAKFQAYLDKNPGGAQAGTAKLRLEQIGIHEEIARLKASAAMQESQRQKLLAEAQRELEEASLAQDPLWGRFQARGWMRSDPEVPGRYILSWAGRTVAEVTCGSGRYDLALFDGAELGIQGAMTRTSGSVDRPMKIDATRIEVISASTALR